jgi:hypothetical protein
VCLRSNSKANDGEAFIAAKWLVGRYPMFAGRNGNWGPDQDVQRYPGFGFLTLGKLAQTC